MIIDISQVLNNEDKCECYTLSFEQDVFESGLGSFPITHKRPFTLKLCNIESRKLEISGEMELTLSATCDRCLCDVSVPIQIQFQREFPIEEKQLVVQDIEDTDYIIGTSLDTNELAKSEILLHWPMKILCKDDCKGLCSKCGADLNYEECGCDRTVLDPRMAAIQDIFNKFKEV